jgi:hypothetical protein
VSHNIFTSVYGMGVLLDAASLGYGGPQVNGKVGGGVIWSGIPYERPTSNAHVSQMTSVLKGVAECQGETM